MGLSPVLRSLGQPQRAADRDHRKEAKSHALGWPEREGRDSCSLGPRQDLDWRVSHENQKAHSNQRKNSNKGRVWCKEGLGNPCVKPAGRGASARVL